MTTSALVPAEFKAALDDLTTTRVRSEIEFGELPAPVKLAQFSHARSATVLTPDHRESTASGRFVLLFDSDGLEAWNGHLRIVAFVSAEMDADIAIDPLLPEVAWSWLTDCLAARAANYTALGGTVTATSSTRFGDIVGPGRTDDLELRASWTARDEHTGAHLAAFADVLAIAAGLPPEGVTTIIRGSPPNAGPF